MDAPSGSTGVVATACLYMGNERNTGSPVGWWGECPQQPVLREERTGPDRVADRVVVLTKSGNADGGKDPWSESSASRGARRGDWR